MIQVLDKHVADLIAAGEVVERPASVIKELVENAIDAGARAVTVEIQHGGVTLMRVTDDGCGIPHAEVPIAFLRHATSKVRDEMDLEAIGTLGFRGEALASIASVSRVSMLTHAAGEADGTRYEIEGSEETVYEEAGCPRGTTILIRDLFYNTPARMKFLKKDVSEGNAVAGVLDRIALSHPEVSLRFVREGKQQLLTPGDGDLYSCAYAVYGKAFADQLMPVDYEADGVRVHGLIIRPLAARQNRTMQSFFINGRYVKTRTGQVALEEAYKHAIQAGRFPACILHIELPRGLVDVNVHPAKVEVRFQNERPVFSAIYHGVQNALAAHDGRPHLALGQPKPAVQTAMDALQPAPAPQLRLTPSSVPTPASLPANPKGFERLPASDFLSRYTAGSSGGRLKLGQPSESPYRTGIRLPAQPASPVAPASVTPPQEEHRPSAAQLPLERMPASAEPDATPADAAEPVVEAPPAPQTGELPAPDIRLIGEVFGTYVIAQVDDAVYLIDKHAAHERMLFEALKARQGALSRQLLLSPVVVTLPRELHGALLAHPEQVERLGFRVEDFGGGSVIVREAATLYREADIPAVVEEIAAALAAGKLDLTPSRLDELYHSIACRAAIKAHDLSNERELRRIVELVQADASLRYCPHGRPIAFVLTRHELERQFGRVM